MNSAAPWTDEELMAYADGQLGGERGARLAAAIAADAALRERVDALAAQRRRVAAAFADVLDEPVPDRLSALLTPPPVVDLAAERRRRAAPEPTPAASRPGLSWMQWGGMAASLALGLQLAPARVQHRTVLGEGGRHPEEGEIVVLQVHGRNRFS